MQILCVFCGFCVDRCALRPLISPASIGELFHKVRYTRSRSVADNVSFAMPKETRERLLARSAKSLQENAERAGPAASASYTLIGAIILLGGIGYAVDRWQGTSPWFLLAGLALGLIVGFYELARTVWHR